MAQPRQYYYVQMEQALPFLPRMRQQDFAVIGSDRPVFHARLAVYRSKLFLPDGRRLHAEFAFSSDEGLTVSEVLELTKQKYGVNSPARPYKTVFTIPGDGADGNCVVENLQIEAESLGIHCFFFRDQVSPRIRLDLPTRFSVIPPQLCFSM